MPTTTMTVKYVNPPKAGKQRGSIKATDGQILGVFADKLHLFEPGSTYEIEYTETISNGVTYRNVKSATVIAAPADTPTPPAPATFHGYRETSPTDAKRMFVCANLTALIRAGEAGCTKISAGCDTRIANLWQDIPPRWCRAEVIDVIEDDEGDG
jgi:hypothetical protein